MKEENKALQGSYRKNTVLSPTYPTAPPPHFRILVTCGSAWFPTQKQDFENCSLIHLSITSLQSAQSQVTLQVKSGRWGYQEDEDSTLKQLMGEPRTK